MNRQQFALAILVAVGALEAMGCGPSGSGGGGGDGGAGSAAQDADGGDPANPPDAGTQPGASACTPCVGTCVPEIVRAGGLSDGRFAFAGSKLFRGGPLRTHETSTSHSNQIFWGPIDAKGADELTPFQPFDQFRLSAKGSLVLVLDVGRASGDHATVLDGATGALLHDIDVLQFENAGAVGPYLVTSRGVYHHETIYQGGYTVGYGLHFYSFAERAWRQIRMATTMASAFVADDAGAYIVADGSIEHVDGSGTIRVLAAFPTDAEHSVDGMLASEDTLYLSAGTSSDPTGAPDMSRLCDSSSGSAPSSYVFAVPKNGGTATPISHWTVTSQTPALTLRHGNGRALVLAETQCIGTSPAAPPNLWLLPTSGADVPKGMFPSSVDFDPVSGDIAGDDAYVYFVTGEDGTIARACYGLP